MLNRIIFLQKGKKHIFFLIFDYFIRTDFQNKISGSKDNLFFLIMLYSMQNLSSPPGVEPMPWVLGAGSLNHWAIREVPK